MEKHTFTTLLCSDPAWFDTRLDKYLFAQFPQYSRTYFQELIDEGLILVNNKIPKSNYHLKSGDSIGITFKIKQYNLEPMPVDFQIVDEQQDFLIINKPAGLLVHPTLSAADEATLVNGLLYHFKEIQSFDDKERPGIVHRLDKNTSGLLIIARNQSAQKELSAMFKNRAVHKKYIALVHKHPSTSGTIDLPIGRDMRERHKMGVFGIEHRPAITHYKILATYADCSLLQATIVTGRTHQIRVHCASMGHSIVGDAVYGTQSPLISRQALHSWHIDFEFRGKSYTYTCPIPEDFRQLLKTVNQKKT